MLMGGLELVAENVEFVANLFKCISGACTVLHVATLSAQSRRFMR